MRWAFAIVVAVCGCITGDPPPPVAVCTPTSTTGLCSCTANQDGEGNGVACPAKTADPARTQCCAGKGWPELGTCNCFTQSIKAACGAGEVAGACGCSSASTGSADACPTPPPSWGLCCFDSSLNNCVCFINAATCPSGSAPTARCDAAKVGTDGACGYAPNGACACSRTGSLAGPLTDCGPGPKPTCCLGSDRCLCTYGSTCASDQTNVDSCNAAIVEERLLANPRKSACTGLELAVTSCGPISQSNPI